MVRKALLWCAQNEWLAAHVPRWGFARRAVRRFLPGEHFDDALNAAVAFKAQGVGVLFTRLGENVRDLSEAIAVVEHYESVLAKVTSSGLHAEISVKPTQVGLDIDADMAYANLERLARAAEKAGSFLWIDMESGAYTQATLDLYIRLRAHNPGTGVCLQAYLFRTVDDVVRLMNVKPAIRLVKGAYAEPPDRAYAAKQDVDANYLALCALMLPEVKRGDLRLVLGTHDVALIERTGRIGHALGLERAQIEVNMLYGIRTDQQVRLAKDGYVVRALIAYGEAWYQWYLRRLAERPANVLFVARQLLP
ncbi:MAG: proline dehydrogenase family protein [Candidatus Dormibacteraceae bacterium]